MHRSLRRLILATSLFILSAVFGTMGFMILEDFSLIDAAYMSIITFSTVGFTEVNPLSPSGKVFTSAYIVVNLVIFAYTVSVLSSFLIEGDLRTIFKVFKTSREVKKYNNHIIVCGFGKNGSQACQELHAENKTFVVVEKNGDIIQRSREAEKYMFINGNATLDEVLIEAGVERAAAVITTLPNDADNVFITLTAKEINPVIHVIAKATELNSESKLYRAGASHVVMPDRLGGMHMANLITKPIVIEFLELLNGVGDEKLILEEVAYESLKSEYRDHSVRDLNIRDNTGVTVIAFKDDAQGFIFNPQPGKLVSQGDTLIVLGTANQIGKFTQQYVVS